MKSNIPYKNILKPVIFCLVSFRNWIMKDLKTLLLLLIASQIFDISEFLHQYAYTVLFNFNTTGVVERDVLDLWQIMMTEKDSNANSSLIFYVCHIW